MQRKLTISCGEYTRTRPLLDGRVQVKGFRLQVVPDPFPEQGMLPDYQHARNQQMLVDNVYDVSEMGMAPYLSARAAGAPLMAIPVFHYRRFRHGYLFGREGAGIERPEDLIGHRVGVRRLNLTAGVWVRALLEHEYGVALDQITWVVAIDVPVRPDVRHRLKIETAPPGENLEDLLVRGDIDAMIEASTLTRGSPGIRRILGEDTRQLEVDYYTRTGMFPIMHSVVIRRDVVARFPDLPRALHRAFEEAKAVGIGDPDTPLRYVLAEEERCWWRSLTDEQRQTMCRDGDIPRDPWIYSVHEDRKTIETFLDYAYEQGLTPVRARVEDLFAGSTLRP
ncbi:MAG: ABC transporter substrate-binding protein [Candidatus Binatia bacterium]